MSKRTIYDDEVEMPSIAERVSAQISFWEMAAEQWAELGKPFKRQECQAAAKALRFAFAAM